MVDYTQLWQQLDALMRKEAPRAFRNLRGPITPAGLGWLQSQAGRGGGSLHPAVAATYAAHDGAKGSRSSLLGILPTSAELDWARACSWHSARQSREEQNTWQDALGTDELGGQNWFPNWMPMGSDGGGNAIILGLTTGDISAFDHEVAHPETIVSLTDFLHTLEADLRAGVIGEDDNGEFTRGDTRPVVNAAAPDEANTFLHLLNERGVALISPTEALRDAVRPLLAIKPTKRRVKELSALLYDHDDVAEVFADDDVLAVAIEEFT